METGRRRGTAANLSKTEGTTLARLLVVICLILFAGHALPARAESLRIDLYILDAPGEGFNDPLLGPPRVEAIVFAGGLWASFFESSFRGETVRVGVSVAPLRFEQNDAEADPIVRMIGGLWLPAALVKHTSGVDLFPNELDGRITFNPRTDFFLGTTGDPGGRVDFVTLALHELGHIFGFASTILKDGTYDRAPAIYDLFVADRLGSLLLGLEPTERAAAITSNDGLFWVGPKGVAGNGGRPPNLSAGPTFVAGGNVWHLSEGFGPGNLLMDLRLGFGEVIRALAPVERGMFEDLGWTIAGPAPQDPAFRRGDASGDGDYDISDPIVILGCLFLGSPCPACADTADVNDDGFLDITDPVYFLAWRFLTGPMPPPPHPACGTDSTQDSLSQCEAPLACP